MEWFPQDVLGLILGFLDAKSHARFSVTCKRAHSAVSAATKLDAALRTADEAGRLVRALEAPIFEPYARGISRALSECAKRTRGSHETARDVALTRIIKRREKPPAACSCLAGCSRPGQVDCAACDATVCREHAEPFFCEPCNELIGCDVCDPSVWICVKCDRRVCSLCSAFLPFKKGKIVMCLPCIELFAA